MLSFARNYLVKPVFDHFTVLYHEIDPIKLRRYRSVRPEWHYTFALAFTTFAYLYGTLFHEYWAEGRLNIRTMLTVNGNVFIHQGGPRVIWPQIDFGITLDMLAGMVIIGMIMIITKINPNLAMSISSAGNCVYEGDEKLDSKLSEMLIAKRTKLTPIFKAFFVEINLCPYIYAVHYWLVAPKCLVFNLFWLFLYPLYFYYVCYGMFCPQMFIILSSRYICVRQKYLLNQMEQINRRLLMRQGVEGRLTFLSYWLRFEKINREIIHLCIVVREYTRFALPLLSMIIPFFIVIYCLCFGMVFFVTSLSPMFQRLFLAAAMGVNFILLFITYQCAAVVKGNNRFERENYVFYLNYFVRNCHLDQKLTRFRFRFKCESLCQRRRLRCYAFHLADGRRITTNTYNAIISCISVVFMFMHKNYYRN